MKNTHITVVVPQEVKTALQAMAKETGIQLGTQIRNWIFEKLKEEKKAA